MKHKVSNIEFCALIYFIMRANFIGITFTSISTISKQNNWIAILIAIILGIIPLFLITKIMDYEPDKNILQKTKILFGKKIGTIINIILCLLFILMAIFTLYNLNIFISSQYLNKTPILVVSIIFAISFIYVCSKDLIVMCRTFLFLFFISVAFFSTCGIGLISSTNLENLKPFMSCSWNEIFKCVFIYLSYNVLPLFILTIIPKNSIRHTKNLNKHILIIYIISSITLLDMSIETIGSLGINLTLLTEYPEFHVLKNISFFGSKSRLDSILFMHWIFDLFTFICMSMYFFNRTFKEIFKFKTKKLYYFISAIILIIGIKFIKNITLFNYLVKNILNNIIFLIISILIIIISTAIKKSTKC